MNNGDCTYTVEEKITCIDSDPAWYAEYFNNPFNTLQEAQQEVLRRWGKQVKSETIIS